MKFIYYCFAFCSRYSTIAFFPMAGIQWVWFYKKLCYKTLLLFYIDIFQFNLLSINTYICILICFLQYKPNIFPMVDVLSVWFYKQLRKFIYHNFAFCFLQYMQYNCIFLQWLAFNQYGFIGNLVIKRCFYLTLIYFNLVLNIYTNSILLFAVQTRFFHYGWYSLSMVL